ncbi:MAG: phosphate ABC transporter substrate-binding protein [Methylovulum sp.]|nr:MAG: phosphate ABC transporter substrate-binding protein [Methylovulum sp.]
MKKPGIIIVLVLMTSTTWWLLQSQPSEPKIEKLVLTGSSTIAPLAAEIGKRFESLHRDVRVDVQTGGSSRGISDARAKLADIGMVSRALKDDEKDLQCFTVALDGIAVILNKANPVAALDKQQIIAIYTGKVVNWKDVGGNDAPITVVNKAEGRSTLELFLHYFGLKNTDVKPQAIIGDNQQGIKTVLGNPDAIGYVSVGTAEYEAGQGAAIKLLPLDGIAASMENVRNRSFPLARPLNLVTRSEPTGRVKDFIEFAESPQVHDLIEAQYFVPAPR